MPSSTSSSNDRLFDGGWLRTWVCAVLLVAIVLTGLEVFWRSRGHRPSVVNDLNLWALYRAQVEQADLNTVVLLGASRIQLGFDTQTFREQYPDHRVVQLAINGRSPLYTLRDLSRTPEFRGTVICSVMAGMLRPHGLNAQRGYVEHYHKQYNLTKQLDRRISTLIQEHLIVVNPLVGPRQILARGQLPPPNYLLTFADRSRAADYTMLDLPEHRRRRIRTVQESAAKANPPTPAQWLSEIEPIESWVRQIQQRGGRVVFVRMPTTDEHWEADEQLYPRAQYWDRFAATTSAQTLHFKDVPDIAAMDCPDTSHLDQRDRARFTMILAEKLFGPSQLALKTGQNN